MIELFHATVAAVWRASWQATVLALLALILLRVLGDRVSARWRHCLWCVVLLRLLLPVPPGSSISLFNLFETRRVTVVEPADELTDSIDSVFADAPESSHNDSTHAVTTDVVLTAPDAIESDRTSLSVEANPSIENTITVADEGVRFSLSQFWSSIPAWSRVAPVLAVGWLFGCLLMIGYLLINGLTLRSRLSACRVIQDQTVMDLVKDNCARMGIGCDPLVLVTPEPISPFLVGAMRPRIVVPEMLLSVASDHWLRHALIHELAHLRRGDLWTNWLLLLARVVHWCNPLAWWITHQVQAEGEVACDQLAIGVLGESERSQYAMTLVDLASCLPAPTLTPALIGIVSSSSGLQSRIERLVHSSNRRLIPSVGMVGILLVVSAIGLTDAVSTTTAADVPGAEAKGQKSSDSVATDESTEDRRVTVRGVCFERETKKPLAGACVRIFEIKGITQPIIEVGNVVTNEKGEYEFADMVPPRGNELVDKLLYNIMVEVDGRPIGAGGNWWLNDASPQIRDIPVLKKATRIAGRVIDSRGKPVEGASVGHGWYFDRRHIPGFLSDVTDEEGGFEIDRIQVFRDAPIVSLSVFHPDYPDLFLKDTIPSPDFTVQLPDGCRVTGSVKDQVTGRPRSRTVVLARGAESRQESIAIPDLEGKFQFILPEGTYDFLAVNKQRTCVALTNRECLAGSNHELPPLSLIQGGFITGRVINTATHEILSKGNGDIPISIGWIGPSNPLTGNLIPHKPQVTVDSSGRFRLQVPPGDNYPFFNNIHGDRMGWNTHEQAAVKVLEGETVEYDMLVTPKVPAEQKLKAARDLIAALPKPPAERTARILVELRKLDHTIDETELWCSLLRELVQQGPQVVPQICEELDQTDNERMLRRLAFALRAIGDTSAIPALIRSLPKTLQPPTSDYGLRVEDLQLAAWMRKSGAADEGGGGGVGDGFDFGRAAREVCTTLNRLTRHRFQDDEFIEMSLSQDPRRQILQRRVYSQFAERWKEWWNANGQKLVETEKFEKVELPAIDNKLLAAVKELGSGSTFADQESGLSMLPHSNGRYARQFLDLDTLYQPRWPAEIPRDVVGFDHKPIVDWINKTGVDLMCARQKNSDGTESIVLRGFGLKAWEITPRDLRRMDTFLSEGKLPPGREVKDLLVHVDPGTNQPVPEADAAFVYITKEGNRGVIEVLHGKSSEGIGRGISNHVVNPESRPLNIELNLRSIVP